MKIWLGDLYWAAPSKPAGYLDAVLALGPVRGDYLEITSPTAYATLCAHYRQYGDAFAVAAAPIARMLDKHAGTHLEGCGGCSKRQRAMNGGAKPVKVG